MITINIDNFKNGVLNGWAFTTNHHESFFIEANIDNSAKTIICPNIFRQDLADKFNSSGEHAFKFNIPISFYDNKKHTIQLTPVLNGIAKKSASVEFSFDELKLNSLIIADSSDLYNASRVYRCEHLYYQLKASNVNCTIKSLSEVEIDDLTNIQLVFFCRSGYSNKISNLIHHARNNNAYLIYETDDLFLSWTEIERRVEQLANKEKLLEVCHSRMSCFHHFDLSIVSTLKLANTYETFGIPTVLSKNCVEDYRIKKITRKESKELKILYMSGSKTHNSDFKIIINPLVKFLNKNPDVNLTFLGETFTWPELEFHKNIKYLPLVSRDMMFNIISEFDVVLVPLRNIDYNNAKSNIKYIESGAVGVPVMASPTDEYKRSIKDGHSGFLCDSEEDWISTLELLKANPMLSIIVGKNAQNDVLKNYTLTSQAGYAIKELLARIGNIEKIHNEVSNILR